MNQKNPMYKHKQFLNTMCVMVVQ